MNNPLSRFIQHQWQLGRVGTIAGKPTVALDEARAYLMTECQRLQQQGYVAAIAPMHRNTWYAYRCIVESDGRPLFWGEPELPSYWHEALVAEGFEAIACYQSAICTDLALTDPRQEELHEHFTQMGVRLRAVNLHQPQSDLLDIYHVAIAAFQRNYLFEAIEFAEFYTLYKPLLPTLNPAMVLVAEQQGDIVGFVLGIPDGRSPQNRTIILKTVAIQPGRQYAGLGRWLVGEFHLGAAQQGYHDVIHALMHEANPSRKISQLYAQPFRRYGLWAKGLK